MSSRRRITRKVGDVLSIPLGDGRTGFALVLEEPLVAFFDYSASGNERVYVDEIARKPVAFRIWVMNRAITGGEWPIIGHVEVPDALQEPPWFFKQDPISKRLSVLRTGAEEIPADIERCRSLERAAVWEAAHVVDRLKDHFAGRKNKWVESMRPKG